MPIRTLLWTMFVAAAVAAASSAPAQVLSSTAEGSALVASLLARFASNAADKTDLDQQVDSTLRRLPRSREVAARISARVQRLTAAQRQRAFGASSGRTNIRVTVADWRAATSRAPLTRLTTSGIRSSLARKPALPSAADVLPAEPVPLPSEFELRYTGLQCTKAADADGSDEPVVVASIAHFVSQKSPPTFATQTVPPAGTASVGQGAYAAGNVSLYKGSARDLLLIGALLEDDAGDAAPQAEEVKLLLELSGSLAASLGGVDPLATLKTALEYSFGLQQISDPARWSDKTIQVSRITANDMKTLYPQPPQVAGGIESKLETTHNTGGGDYSLFFTVPAGPAPSMTTVRVTVERVRALDPVDAGGTANFEASVAINGQSKTKTLTPNAADVSPNWRVERSVLSGSVTISIGLSHMGVMEYGYKKPGSTDFTPGASGPYPGKLVPPYAEQCGEWPPKECPPQYEGNACANWKKSMGSGTFWPCPPYKPEIDVDPTADKSKSFGQGTIYNRTLAIQYNPANGLVTGSATGKKDQSIKASGDRNPRGEITFRVTHQ